VIFILKSVRDLEVRGKRVLVRVDFNVPLKAGEVTNDSRIRASLPTIKYLLKKKAKVILISHLGRPEGRPVESLRLDPVAAKLAALLKLKVHKLDDCIGKKVQEEINKMREGEIILLENVRFYREETKNDPRFAQSLSELADIFIHDAFAAAHRRHASTYEIAKLLPSAAGFLLEKEVEMLSRAIEDPEHPFIAIIGGKKAEEKIGNLLGLLKHVDIFLIGGGIAFTFLKALGYQVGESVIDEDFIAEVKEFMERAAKAGAKVLLPLDVQIAPQQKLLSVAAAKNVSAAKIPPGWMGLDIGPQTVREFKKELQQVKTILWAGPLGAFELPQFAKGTAEIAKAVVESQAFAIIGGGETGAAIEEFGLAEAKNIYISTGGGATLEFLAGKEMPGIEVLQR